MGQISRIVNGFKVTPEDVPRIEDTLFYDGPNRRKKIERFAVLMFFATFIATYGVIADSTATVIGAMLIAPLMTPVLAVAAAVVTGQMQRALYSLLVVILGVAGAVGLAWILGELFHSGVISMTSNSQIVSRVSPRLVDLYAALGAGAVGAFATCRKDIADTLPGAAIAIALVPPLAVVGLALSQGEWKEAEGAMLLFLTNFFAILIAGSSIFALLGLSALTINQLKGHSRRRAFQLIVIGTLLVAVPLALTSFNTLAKTQTQIQTRKAAEQWLEETDYEVVSTNLQSDGVLIRITGSGETPPKSDLVDAIQESGQHEIHVKLEVIPSQIEEFTVQ